jgi:YVTN family beta-propeller protein
VAQLPAGAVTFLFTDIEGSTQLVKQLRDRYPEVLAEHRRLLRDAFVAYGGHEIDTQGDAFFVAFASARDAVLAAIDGQRALARHSWPEGVHVRVRIGIHTGQASPSDGRYTGVAVHRAARISAAGHGGQILISQTTHNLLEDEEEDIPGVEFLDLGEHQLKDLDRPVRLYQVAAEGLAAEFPPIRTAAPAPAAAPEQPYYRRRTILIGALAGVIAVAVAIPLFALGGEGSPEERVVAARGNAVGVLDAGSGDPKGAIEAPAAPTAVAAGLGYVWVASADANTLYVLDPETRTVRDQIPLDGSPGGIAIGAGYVWVTNSEAGSVAQIDPDSFTVLQAVPVGNGPTGVAADARHVWVTNTTDHTVSRVDVRTGESVDFPAGADPTGIALGNGSVWVASKSSNEVLELNPRGDIVKEISVGEGPAAVAVGEGAVWVANSLAGTVSKIDPDSATVVGAVEVGGTPSGLVATNGHVWVVNEVEGRLSSIDSDANEATPVRIGGRPTAVAAEGTDLYVGLRPPGSAHRGGTLRVLSGGDDFFTIDPAVAFDTDFWRFLTLTNDSLVTYRRVSGGAGYQLVPDLASALPVVSHDGKTYTFELRPGIRYSSGGMVKASDVRSSLERVFRVWPHGQGAVAQFYGGIEGADACSRKRCELSRGIVTDDAARTVTFHLTAPDPIFLHKLAQPYASVLPSTTVRNVAARSPVAATGPYRIGGVVRGRMVRLVRNPRFREWSRAAQPAGFPDAILIRFVESDRGSLSAVRKGQADLTSLDPLDPAPVEPTLQPQVRRYPLAVTKYFVLNPNRPPFNDARAREALNYAVDREKVVELTGLDAEPTCQMLPPNFPGYRRYCPYTLHPNSTGTWTAPDPAKARRLVAASGTKGDAVTIWFPGTPETGRVGRYIASVLGSLGYRVRVKSGFEDEGAYFFAMTAAEPQIASAGWFAVYPTADEFLGPPFTCGSEANFGHFCDRAFDRKTAHALQMQSQDPAAANRLWERLDHEITDRAVLLPLYNAYGADVVSKRVGNYQYNPQYGALLSQIWVR